MKPKTILTLAAVGLAAYMIGRKVFAPKPAPVSVRGNLFADKATADHFAAQDAMFK